MLNQASWTTDELRMLLATISHQLRTPLSVITGRASVVREQIGAEHRRDLDTIIEEAHGLSHAFESLLAILDSRREPPGREWVPLEEIVGAVLIRFASTLDGRSVMVDIPHGLLVHVHPVRGELLVANILRCALAHGRPGAPIRILGRRSEDTTSIEITPGPADQALLIPSTDGPPRHGDHIALAASRAIAATYGGTFEIADTNDAVACRVRIVDGEPMPELAGVGERGDGDGD